MATGKDAMHSTQTFKQCYRRLSPLLIRCVLIECLRDPIACLYAWLHCVTALHNCIAWPHAWQGLTTEMKLTIDWWQSLNCWHPFINRRQKCFRARVCPQLNFPGKWTFLKIVHLLWNKTDQYPLSRFVLHVFKARPDTTLFRYYLIWHLYLRSRYTCQNVFRTKHLFTQIV